MLKAILQTESKCQFLSAIGKEDTCDFRMKFHAAEMKQERRIVFKNCYSIVMIGIVGVEAK